MRRMYSESELREFIRNHGADVVQSLVGKDISVEGITSKGIANTGAIANIGDVAITGDLSVSGSINGEENPSLKGNIRDYASMNELICLSNLENINAVLITEQVPQKERLVKLNRIAIYQISVWLLL